jgi:PAS domain S-box-containing protein
MPLPGHPLLSDPVQRNRLIVIGTALILALSANITALFSGITSVFPHLFYIPVLLAGYWYPRRGPVIALCIASLYGGTAFLMTPSDLFTTLSIISRGVVLVIIGVIVSLLAVRLRRSEQQLHDLIEFLPDATFAVDLEGKVIAWNRAIEEMTGVPKMKMVGEGNYAYAVPFYGEARPVLIDLALTGNPKIEADYPVMTRNGDLIEAEIFAPALGEGKGLHLRLSATPLFDAGRERIGAVESIRNITDEVLTRSSLENSNRQLGALSSIIRHGVSARLEELYRHLTIGSMQFDDPAAISFLGKIEEAADGIRRQIAISRDFREIGSSPPLWTPMQDAVARAIARLDTGGMTIRVWTERLVIFSDPHLSTAFSHLIENALAAGATALLVTYQIRDDGCAIYLEDNGVGIPDEKKKRLFSEGIEHSGHGLFLAREVLSITGISLYEEGQVGLGARFVLLVPPEGYRII